TLAGPLGGLHDLGTLFPSELENSGVRITRQFTAASAATSEFFEVYVLQAQVYRFTLSGAGLPATGQVVLMSPTGDSITVAIHDGKATLQTFLAAGTYELHIT